MLERTRLALRISTHAYDAELASLIIAAAKDLTETAGIPVTGIKLTTTWSGSEATVTDESTIKDELLIRAIITYVRFNFGSPADYDRLQAAYDRQKAQLQMASGYGLEEGKW